MDVSELEENLFAASDAKVYSLLFKMFKLSHSFTKIPVGGCWNHIEQENGDFLCMLCIFITL